MRVTEACTSQNYEHSTHRTHIYELNARGLRDLVVMYQLLCYSPWGRNLSPPGGIDSTVLEHDMWMEQQIPSSREYSRIGIGSWNSPAGHRWATLSGASQIEKQIWLLSKPLLSESCLSNANLPQVFFPWLNGILDWNRKVFWTGTSLHLLQRKIRL